MTIFGWDASHYDWGRGPMDLAGAVRAGISFMTHKATEGTAYTDTQYAAAAARARTVMPLFGAYHVLHSGSVNAQVDHYLAVLRSASPWWQSAPFIVQLDCEQWPTDFPTASDISAWCARFVAVTGGTHRPIVYASRGQYDGRLGGIPYPLWNAAYPSSASGSFRSLYPGDGSGNWSVYSGHTPVIWQYTSTATIGSQSDCDVNAYRGVLAELSALTLLKDQKMIVIARERSSGYVWRCDGISRSWIPDSGKLSALISWGVSHGAFQLFARGAIQVVDDGALDSFGTIVGPDPTAMATKPAGISDAEIEQITAAAAQSPVA